MVNPNEHINAFLAKTAEEWLPRNTINNRVTIFTTVQPQMTKDWAVEHRSILSACFWAGGESSHWPQIALMPTMWSAWKCTQNHKLRRVKFLSSQLGQPKGQPCLLVNRFLRAGTYSKPFHFISGKESGSCFFVWEHRSHLNTKTSPSHFPQLP